MGIHIDREEFSAEDHAEFALRLDAQLRVLREILASPAFGHGDPSLGAEVELPLVQKDGRPATCNREVLKAWNEPRATLEIAKYNLELNLTPVPAAGSPFTAMADEFNALMKAMAPIAADHGASALPIGILPTVTKDAATRDLMTDLPRYRAMDRAITDLRQGPASLCIRGPEALDVQADGVILEGANTSFQVHLRVNPDVFADTYNAGQLATGVALAVAGNSPIFLEHLLWDETRIAVFKQSVDARRGDELAWHRPSRVAFGHGWVRKGAYELFAESVRLHRPLFPVCAEPSAPDPERPPELAELRLHHGTVWRWNRAIYDPNAGGHLRVEFRALPSGPTAIDMMANAAFTVGLSTGLRERMAHLTAGCPFLMADTSFHRAARDGLDAMLLWPDARGYGLGERSVPELVERLIPVAQAGLSELGVDASEGSRLLGVIADRVKSGQTGARWQRAALRRLGAKQKRRAALAELVREYAARAAEGLPVHRWSPV